MRNDNYKEMVILGYCRRCGSSPYIPAWKQDKFEVDRCDKCVTPEEQQKFMEEAQKAMDSIVL